MNKEKVRSWWSSDRVKMLSYVSIFMLLSLVAGGQLIVGSIIAGGAISLTLYLLWMQLPVYLRYLSLQFKMFTDVTMTLLMVGIGGSIGVTALLGGAYAGIFLSVMLRLYPIEPLEQELIRRHQEKQERKRLKQEEKQRRKLTSQQRKAAA